MSFGSSDIERCNALVYFLNELCNAFLRRSVLARTDLNHFGCFEIGILFRERFELRFEFLDLPIARTQLVLQLPVELGSIAVFARSAVRVRVSKSCNVRCSCSVMRCSPQGAIDSAFIRRPLRRL